MIVGTVSSASHLSKAMRLAQSVKEHMPGSKFVCGIMEEEMPSSALQWPYFDEVVLMRDTASIAQTKKFFFQYTEQEALRACKALLVQYMYTHYQEENIIVYMNADTLILSPLVELKAAVQTNSIVLTGNVIYPEALDMDLLSSTRYSGIYHSGLFVFGRHPAAERFIAAWSKLSERGCHLSANKKIYADQPWLDLAHTLFEKVYTLRHPGYLVGYSNLVERWNIQQDANYDYFIDNDALRTLDFSNDFLLATSWIDSEKGQIYRDLYYKYSNGIDEISRSGLSATPWSYGRFFSGEIISDQTKEMFRLHYYDHLEIDDPFTLSNAYFKCGEPQEAAAPDSVEQLFKQEVKRSRGSRARKRIISRKKITSTRKKRRRS